MADLNSTLEFGEYKLETKTTLEIEGMKVELKRCDLTAGILFISLKDFVGFFFVDKYGNVFDLVHKNIYFHDKITFFEGDLDKEAYSLLENFEQYEKRIKEGKEEMKKTEDEDEKSEIENSIVEGLIKELEKFDLNKVILITVNIIKI